MQEEVQTQTDCVGTGASVQMCSHQSFSWKELANGNQGPHVCSSEGTNLFAKTVPLEQQVTRSQKQGGTQ